MVESSSAAQQSNNEPTAIGGEPDIIVAIDRLEHQLSQRLTRLKKLKELLAKTRKSLESKTKPAAAATSLLSHLRKESTDLFAINTAEVAAATDAFLKSWQSSGESGFGEALLRASEEHKIDLRSTRDGFLVGPFELVVNFPKESATPSYAHEDICGVRLEPDQIVKNVLDLRNSLLRKPDNLSELAEQLAEAIRVTKIDQHRVDQSRISVERKPLLSRRQRPEFVVQLPLRRHPQNFSNAR